MYEAFTPIIRAMQEIFKTDEIASMRRVVENRPCSPRLSIGDRDPGGMAVWLGLPQRTGLNMKLPKMLSW